MARAGSALVEGPALAAYEPQAGDALCSLGAAGPHVSCVTAATWEPGARLVLEAVDGGQGRKGDMAIEGNLYALERTLNGAFVRSIEPTRWSPASPGPAKPVRWYADLWALVLNAGLLKA